MFHVEQLSEGLMKVGAQPKDLSQRRKPAKTRKEIKGVLDRSSLRLCEMLFIYSKLQIFGSPNF